MKFVEVNEDRLYQLEENEKIYEKAISMLRDLLPKKEDIEKTIHTEENDLWGLLEEVDYILESCIDEVRK